jgi:hypothetical protein
MRLEQSQKLWVDQVKNRYPTVARGSYLTDSPFLNELHRAPLGPGVWAVRVVLVFGEVPRAREFQSAWRKFTVLG